MLGFVNISCYHFLIGINSTMEFAVNATTIPNEYFLNKTIVKVQAMSRSSLALASDGTMFSWGQLYHKDVPMSSPYPLLLTDFPVKAVDISCKVLHCLILVPNGTVFAFGSNLAGSLCQGEYTHYSGFVPIPYVTGSQIAAGQHTVVMGFDKITQTDTIYSCGGVTSYVTGDLTSYSRALPTKAAFDTASKILSIHAGFSATYVLREDGFYSWGLN